MPELSLIDIIKYSIKSLLDSKVFILVILEIAILFMALIFSRLMNKKVVKVSCLIESLIVFGLYISSYVGTVITFINNVSTKLIELIYFPTTLEFFVVMIISFIIMGITYMDKKKSIILKIINSVFPLTVSFLFLSIIEYINANNVPFDEFSVFTNPILMSLYELAMGLFITWIIGLIVYKVDLIIIDSISGKEEDTLVESTLNIEASEEEEESDVIELPRLKNGVIK